MLRVVSLNVRQGGRRHARQLAEGLVATAADVAVLAEVRATSDELLARLEVAGYVHQQGPADGIGRSNAVVVASRVSVTRQPPTPGIDPGVAERWLEIDVEDVRVVGVHVPFRTRQEKDTFWAAMLDCADGLREEPALLVGDLNTGHQAFDREGARLWSGEAFDALTARAGWVDAFRAVHGSAREYSWFSRSGNGFRIDHAFLSPGAAGRLVRCFYDHRLRLDGRTDHSALVLELR